MQNNRNWLQIAEYVSIAGSMLGTGLAVAYQQVLYAGVPFSLSLLLNLANRSRLERWRSGGEIVQVQRQILEEMDFLGRQMAELPAANDSPSVRQAISDLAQAISYLQSELSVQGRDLRTMQNNLQNLASQKPPSLAIVQAQIEELKSTLINNQPVVINSNIDHQIKELGIALRDNQSLDIKPELNRLFGEIEKLQNQQTNLYQSFNQTSRETDLVNQHLITNIGEEEFNQITEIIQQTSRQELEIIGAALDQLQQELREQNQQIEKIAALDGSSRIEAGLNLISAETLAVSEIIKNELINNLQNKLIQQIEIINQGISQIYYRLDKQTTQPTANQPINQPIVDLTPLQQQLSQLSQQIQDLPNQIQIPTPIESETPDLNPVREGIFKLRNEMMNFKEFFENAGETIATNVKKVEERISNLGEEKTSNQQMEEEFEDEDFEEEDFEESEPENKAEAERETIPFVSASKSGKHWKLTNILKGHSSAVNSLAINSASKILASASCREIKLWNLETGTELNNLDVNSEAMAIADLTIHPDGELLAVANANIELWNLRSKEKIRTLETSSWPATVIISLDGKIMVSAGEDPVDDTGSIQIWKLPKAELLHDLGPDIIYTVALSPKRDILVSAGMTSPPENNHQKVPVIQLRKLPTTEIISTIEETKKITTLAISNDGQNLISAGEDGIVKIRYLATGQLLRKIQAHNAPIHSLAITPDGETLATASSDTRIKLWEIHTGKLLQILEEHNEKVAKVLFSPDGKYLISASSDMSVKVYRCA